MTALARAEWLKLRTTRSSWAYLLVVLLLSALAVAGEIGTAEEASRSERGFQLGLFDAIGIASLLALILGITIVTTEFRHGTVTPTFLVEPRRERVIVAKAALATAAAVGLGLLSLLVVVAVGLPWLELVGADIQFADGDVVRRVVRNLFAAILYALMGLAIGTLVQSQVAALVGTLLWVFLGETLVSGALTLLDADAAAEYLPFRALDAADGGGGELLLPYAGGIAVSLGWIALLAGVGTARVLRRDIT